MDKYWTYPHSSLSLSVPTASTVREVKDRLYTEINLPAKDMRLFIDGVELRNSDSLAAANLSSGRLEVMYRIRSK